MSRPVWGGRQRLTSAVPNEPFAPLHLCPADPAQASRVIEGDAAEVTEADGRLLAESIAAEGVDEAQDESDDDEPALEDETESKA